MPLTYSATSNGIALLGDLPLQGLLICSYFVPNQSYPDQRQFFFAYSVTISNEGSDTVQLLNRHWVIHNAEGQKQEVRQAQLHICAQLINYTAATAACNKACLLQ